MSPLDAVTEELALCRECLDVANDNVAVRDRRISALQAERDELAAQVEAMRHVANEWADMATSGMAWLKNIHDGVSSTQDAIDNARQGIAHCREVGVAATESAAAILRQRDAKSGSGALRQGARVIELFDDATMKGDYMLDSSDCASILNAIAAELERKNG